MTAYESASRAATSKEAMSPASRTPSGHTSAICASRVMGTNVKDRSGTTIGEVKEIVLDKMSNNIMFAVVGFGGFLSIGEKYHPIPWASLDYDESKNAYVGDFTKEQLTAAPSDSIEALTKSSGASYRDRAFDYYEVPRYW